MSRESLKEPIINLIVLAAFFTIWQLGAVTFESKFFPKVSEVFVSFGKLTTEGDLEKNTLFVHIFWSMARILAGFALGCVTAIPLGLLTGLFPRFYQTIKVIIEPVRFISPIAWVPMSIILLSGFPRYMFLIWVGAFFPIWVSTMAGVAKTGRVYVNVVKVYGAKRGEIIRKVIWPSILPDIFTGMRIGLGVGWMCIVAAEMIGGEVTGIGRMILKYAELIKLPEVVVGMITIGIVGFFMNEILMRTEKRLFRYRTQIAL